ncbi:MAG: beta-ketoacyl-ACP synthase III [Nitrospirota bacterium]
MLRTKIIGTGSYLPKKVISNYDLEKMVNTSDEWITERTGIKERRIAGDGEATSDLAYHASLKAIKDAKINPKQIELVIVATITPDMAFPSTACILQDRLGLKDTVAFDISAACSGFIFGLAVADQFIKSGIYKTALIVGAETLSKVTDWKDRTTCILFGDGAGAAIIQASKSTSGIISFHLHSDGAYVDLLYIPGGGSRNPASYKTINDGLHFIKMRGNETFKIAVKTLEGVVMEAVEANGISPSEIDLLIPHQANLRIIQATAKRLGLPMEKVLVNIDRYGNTSAASVPIALDEAVRTKRVKKGDLILLEAFGGGLTWAAALIRW